MPHSLSEFAADLTRIAIEMPLAEHEALKKAAEIVEEEAKRVIGTYDYGWPALKPETIARKSRGDTPLLETGEMRDSIGHTVFPHEAYVGSNDMKAVYQELGTSRGIPPRSFLGGAAMHKEHEVWEVTHRFMVSFLVSGFGGHGFGGWVGSGTNRALTHP
jgi:hypothetical protein